MEGLFIFALIAYGIATLIAQMPRHVKEKIKDTEHMIYVTAMCIAFLGLGWNVIAFVLHLITGDSFPMVSSTFE